MRYKERKVRLYFRGDAAFASPEIYEYLEAEGLLYVIRLKANAILQRNIAHLLIPTVIDQNPCAHLRMPRDMIFHGWSMRLFQAWQHSATMSS